jgi:hypothetical protein
MKVNFDVFNTEYKTHKLKLFNKEEKILSQEKEEKISEESFNDFFAKNPNYISDENSIQELEKFENLIHLEKDSILLNFDQISDDAKFNKQFDKLFRTIEAYLPMKNQKKTLNDLFDERIKKTENFLNSLSDGKTSMKIYSQNELFNFISFKKFKKACERINNIKNLPLITKLKIQKEIDKIETKSKRFGFSSTILFTPLMSIFIFYYFDKNFSKEIRNRQKFNRKYLFKLPFLIFGLNYLFFKNLSLLYYLRKPLIDTNSIFGSSEFNREFFNPNMKMMRLNLGNPKHKKIVKNREEYDKFIKQTYNIEIQENTNKKNLLTRWLSFNFYFLSYKTLRMYMYINNKKEIEKITDFMINLNILENRYKVNYLKEILMHNSYQKRVDKIVKEFLNKQSNKFSKYKREFKIRILNPKKNENNLKSYLNKLRVDIMQSNKFTPHEKNKILLQIFYLDIFKNLQKRELNKQIILYYEIQILSKYIKKKDIDNIFKNFNTFLSMIRTETENFEFYDFLKHQNETNHKTRPIFKSKASKINPLTLNEYRQIRDCLSLI